MYQQRMNGQNIINSFNNQFVTAIIGPRRVGKSYFIQNYALQHPHLKWVFLNMDKMPDRVQVENNQLERLIQEHAKQLIGLEVKIWVVIDEAQKSPAIFDQVKTIYDNFKGKDKIKFILSGSAVLSLHKLSAESLAGRIELFHLQEFNLREATLLQEQIPLTSLFDKLVDTDPSTSITEYINQLKPFKPILENQLAELLIWGGFPELLQLPTSNEKISYLNNYLQTYLEKDVRAIETITDINLYRNMLDIFAEQTGSIRDELRITSALGCTRDTLKKYRGYVEATLLYKDVYPYINSSLKRLVKSPKGYLLNNGLISLLTGIADIKILEKTGTIGHRLENWFLNELYIWCERSSFRQHINYWRTSTGIEVDFVVVKKPYVFPFEVTYGLVPDSKKIRSLQKFLQNEPKAQWGYYIYRGEFVIDNDKKIMFMPCWAMN